MSHDVVHYEYIIDRIQKLQIFTIHETETYRS